MIFLAFMKKENFFKSLVYNKYKIKKEFKLVLMNLDEDKILYKEFLDGNMEAFEKLTTKYKTNLTYFIYKYVKNEEIAEDIYQDIIIYLLSKKEIYNFKYSFKTFLYIIAKSRALNYIREQNKYEYNMEDAENLYVEEKMLEEIILSKERKEKIKKVISKMSKEYQIVIYLTIIEGLSYTEVAEIMNKNVSQIKNLVHRARIKLKKLLIQERVVEMKNSKVIKLLLWIFVIGIITSGTVLAATKIYNSIKGKAKMTPVYTSRISDVDTNKVWVGTFNLVWNDLMNDVIGGPIEFEDGYSELANELNKQNFTVKQLSSQSYYKVHGEATTNLRTKIENEIKTRFNEQSEILHKVQWGNPNAYVLYTMLKKEFNYLEKFPTSQSKTFGNSEEKVKYFGIEPDTTQDASKNIDILFYNSKEDFAIKLKTKEGEEVYLYRTTGEGKTFEENYKEMLEKQAKYTGTKKWKKNDILKVPFIKIKDEINYDELCGRYIKGTQWYIRQALQTIDFELNNYGGSVKSEALIEMLKNAVAEKGRDFIFDDTFILYLKESDKSQPYFALKVDNTDVLVSE